MKSKIFKKIMENYDRARDRQDPRATFFFATSKSEREQNRCEHKT